MTTLIRQRQSYVAGRWVEGDDVWPNYDVYQTRTDRAIPVAVLSPS